MPTGARDCIRAPVFVYGPFCYTPPNRATHI
jgi:hypothetical protein